MPAERFDLEVGIPFHRLVVPLQNARIAVHLVEHIRDEHARIRPACGAVHCVHVGIDAARRRDLTEAAVFPLSVAHIGNILARHCVVIEEIARRLNEDLRIARPAVPLTRRTVGGNVGMVVLSRPARVLDKLVEERIGAIKGDRALHIRIDGDGGEAVLSPRGIPLDEDVLEAEDGKFRLVVVDALPTGVLDLLQRGLALLLDALEILLRKFAVLIEHLAEAQL